LGPLVVFGPLLLGPFGPLVEVVLGLLVVEEEETFGPFVDLLSAPLAALGPLVENTLGPLVDEDALGAFVDMAPLAALGPLLATVGKTSSKRRESGVLVLPFPPAFLGPLDLPLLLTLGPLDTLTSFEDLGALELLLVDPPSPSNVRVVSSLGPLLILGPLVDLAVLRPLGPLVVPLGALEQSAAFRTSPVDDVSVSTEIDKPDEVTKSKRATEKYFLSNMLG